MRTTLTIDDDIVAKLKARVAKEKSRTFKDVVNETLRLGLNAKKVVDRPGSFRVRARDLGASQYVNFDNIGELLDQVEGPDHR